jgi:hypothetical protein
MNFMPLNTEETEALEGGLNMPDEPSDIATDEQQQAQQEVRPPRSKKEKRTYTLHRYPAGPYVRQHPKHVRRSLTEIGRAVRASEEYAAAFFEELCGPMIAAGIPNDKAAVATCMIMSRLFQREMRGSAVYKKSSNVQSRTEGN